MKIKIIKLLDSVETLKKLSNEKFQSGKTSFRIARIISAVNKELEIFSEQKNKLNIEQGVTGKENNFIVPPENRDVYIRKLNEILNEEVDINITPINPEEINGYSPNELMSIYWMLDDNAT